jgi:hypothetical protein
VRRVYQRDLRRPASWPPSCRTPAGWNPGAGGSLEPGRVGITILGGPLVIGGFAVSPLSLGGNVALLMALLLGYVVAVLGFSLACSCRIRRPDAYRRPLGGAA